MKGELRVWVVVCFLCWHKTMNFFLVGIEATGGFWKREGWCFPEGGLLQVLERTILSGYIGSNAIKMSIHLESMGYVLFYPGSSHWNLSRRHLPHRMCNGLWWHTLGIKIIMIQHLLFAYLLVGHTVGMIRFCFRCLDSQW